MAATMISQFVEQTNTQPAHFEHFIYDAQPIATGEAANALVETYRKKQEAIAAQHRALAEYRATCDKWQANLAAHLDHCQKSGRTAMAIEIECASWVQRHPFPKPPAALHTNRGPDISALYRT